MDRKTPNTIEKIAIVAVLLIAAVFLVLLTYKGNDSVAAEFVYSVKEDGYASIEGYTGDQTVLEIPEKVGENGEYTVKYIHTDAFANDTVLKKVVLPDSVEVIGKGAFNGCVNLKEVVLSENLSEIGYAAFFGCEKLRNIELPESIKKIDADAFGDCKRLRDLYIPQSCEEIGTDAFLGCENLILDCSDNALAKDVAAQYRIPTSFEESAQSTLIKAGVLSLLVIILVFSLYATVRSVRNKKNILK